MSKICPNCQTINRDTSRFCMNCATPLEGSATGGTPVSGPTSPDSGGSQPNLQTGMMPPESRLQNRYIIVRRLGRGGMGAVYAASDARITGKLWAVKEMSDAAITNPLEKQQAIGAFRQEAEMLARLNHPNLPAVTDFFSEGGKQYLVMELVAGQTLEALLAARPGPFPEAQVLDWVNQLCDVLNYLHNQQPPIVFRDLKPSNIMLEDSGRIKLIDFGIARLFKPGRASDTQAMGTPGYAAPEQYGRGQTDARSDVYSLGVVMHNLLTKHDPSLNPFNFLPVRQLNPAVSPQVEAVIVRALRANPAERYQSVLEMRAALRGSTPPEGLAAPTPAPAGMATVVEPASYTPPGQIPPAGYTPAGGIPQPAYPPAGYTPPQPLPQPSPAPPRKGMPGWVWAAGGLLALILCVVVALTALAIGSQASGGGPFAFLGGGGPPTLPPTELPRPGETRPTEAPTDDSLPPTNTPQIAPDTPQPAPDTPRPEPDTPEPSRTPTPQPTNTPSPTPVVVTELTIGRSAGGQNILAYQLGNGPENLVIIGGLHSGFAPSSVDMAERALAYYQANFDEVPANLRLTFILDANPDSAYDPGGKSGRLNANGVDLNRNWGCNWSADALWREEPIDGGTAPFSEPETRALRDFLLDLRPGVVIFYEARSTTGLAAPGNCNGTQANSEQLAQIYASSAGYELYTGFSLTGDSADWLVSQNISAISILLQEYDSLSNSQFNANLDGLSAIMNYLR